MILVLTHSYFEQGTDPVIDWLLYYKAPFFRICVEDLVAQKVNYSFDIDKGSVIINGVDYSQKVTVIFFRRFYRYLYYEEGEPLGDVSRKVFYEANNELEHFVEALFDAFKDKIWFPVSEMVNVNKPKISAAAHRAGLLSPRSRVINNKTGLLEFKEECPHGCITKSICRISYYTFGKYTYSTYATSVDDDVLAMLPERFFPALFQEKVVADYEVRVFYLDGEFFATAAISTDKDRLVDIKQSFYKESLKWATYQLPKDIEAQLDKFMRWIGLVTGSIDLIKTVDGQYYFLEVNPVGQYSAPSWQGGYQIERRIAEWLIQKNNMHGKEKI
jgi:hypothetical protein